MCAAIDISRIRSLESEQRRLTDELATALQRYETALRGSHVTVYTQDRDLRYTSVSNAMFGRAVDELVGCYDRDDILPPDSSAAIVALKRGVLETGQSKDSEFRVEHGGNVHWYDTHIEALRDTDGEIVGLTCAAVDITGRKAGEAHLREIMRELTHRSKNLLAVIQAMARQTARHTGTIEAFLEQFSARAQALASSHDLLVQESWYGASCSELIRSQLGSLPGSRWVAGLGGRAGAPAQARGCAKSEPRGARTGHQCGKVRRAFGPRRTCRDQLAAAARDGGRRHRDHLGGNRGPRSQRRPTPRLRHLVIERNLSALARCRHQARVPAGRRTLPHADPGDKSGGRTLRNLRRL